MKLSLRFLPLFPLLALAAGGMARAGSPSSHASQAIPIAGSDLDRRIDWLQRRVHDTDQALDDLRGSAATVRQRSVVRGRAYYRLIHSGLLPLGGGFDSLMHHIAQAERLRRGIDRDIALTKELTARRTALLQRRKSLLEQQAPLLVQRRAMTEARQALMEARDRNDAFARAFEPGETDYTAVYGTSGPGPWNAPTADAEPSFASWLGRLPFPLAGRVRARGMQMPDASGPGLALVGQPGATVRAVHEGRVAFAAAFGAYGKVIIIDHGHRYFTLSGQLGVVDVAVGEQVHRGTPIGQTTRVGKHRGELYFEIRHAGETIDPKPWFGL